MKNLSLLILSLFLFSNAYTQQAPIMVCNPAGTTCAPYNTLNEAYTAANNDDYIYIPGGTFQLDSTIKKKINIIGAGFHTDSSLATGKSIINGDIKLGEGCDGSSFEGMYIGGSFINSETSGNFQNNYIQISKCNFNGFGMSNTNCIFNNCIVINSISRGPLYFAHPSQTTNFGNDNLISNSFFSSLFKVNNSTISNCIVSSIQASSCWIAGTNATFYNCTNSTIKNCFLENGVNGLSNTNCSLYGGCSNITMLNNIFRKSDGSGDLGGTYTGSGNQFNQTNLSNHFETATSWGYDESKNYNLKTGTSGKNAGIDSKDIGIYGGSIPWVDGAIPSNPHIYFKNISNATNPNGELPAQIKVRIGN